MRKYLVVRTDKSSPDKGLITWASLETEGQILGGLGMSDCYWPEEIHVYDVESVPGKVTELKLLGTWHDAKDPLLMEAVDPDGNVVFSGHADDH